MTNKDTDVRRRRDEPCTDYGATENAGMEDAGLENAGPNSPG